MPGAIDIVNLQINNRGEFIGNYLSSFALPGTALLYDRGTFTTINYPDSAGTSVSGINNRGQIIGTYLDSSGNGHGFVDNQGRFTTIDPSGSVFTFPEQINEAGQIVGLWFDSNSNEHGFIATKGDDRGWDITASAPQASLADVLAQGDPSFTADLLPKSGMAHAGLSPAIPATTLPGSLSATGLAEPQAFTGMAGLLAGRLWSGLHTV